MQALHVRNGYEPPDFVQIKGIAGDVTTEWTDRNIIQYYKCTWASLQRVRMIEDYKRTVSTKRRSFDNA